MALVPKQIDVHSSLRPSSAFDQAPLASNRHIGKSHFFEASVPFTAPAVSAALYVYTPTLRSLKATAK